MPSEHPPGYPYDVLDEKGDSDNFSRPGTVFVTTLTTPIGGIELGEKKGNAHAITDGATHGSYLQSGSGADCEEPQCEIIVHTAQQDPPPVQYASDYCTLALFVFLCCFLPFGIVGMVKNHESRVKAVAGDYDGAIAAARVALKYSVAGCIIGTICYLAFVAFGMAVLVMTLTGDI